MKLDGLESSGVSLDSQGAMDYYIATAPGSATIQPVTDTHEIDSDEEPEVRSTHSRYNQYYRLSTTRVGKVSVMALVLPSAFVLCSIIALTRAIRFAMYMASASKKFLRFAWMYSLVFLRSCRRVLFDVFRFIAVVFQNTIKDLFESQKYTQTEIDSIPVRDSIDVYPAPNRSDNAATIANAQNDMEQLKSEIASLSETLRNLEDQAISRVKESGSYYTWNTMHRRDDLERDLKRKTDQLNAMMKDSETEDSQPTSMFLSPSDTVLVIVRHVSAVPAKESAGPRDFNRTLDIRGESEAKQLQQKFRDFRIFPDKILCSSSVRTVQTLECLIPNSEYVEANTVYLDELYYALNAQEHNMIISHCSDFLKDSKKVLVIGHAPGIQEWVAQLTGGDIVVMKPGHAVVLRLDTKSQRGEGKVALDWTELTQKRWDLVQVIKP